MVPRFSPHLHTLVASCHRMGHVAAAARGSKSIEMGGSFPATVNQSLLQRLEFDYDLIHFEMRPRTTFDVFDDGFFL